MNNYRITLTFEARSQEAFYDLPIVLDRFTQHFRQMYADGQYAGLMIDGSSIVIDPQSMPTPHHHITPAPRTVHPWEDGAFIFPDDHPLRPYEERAKRGDEAAQEVLDEAFYSVNKALGTGE